jgi:hypothetical protein
VRLSRVGIDPFWLKDVKVASSSSRISRDCI